GVLQQTVNSLRPQVTQREEGRYPPPLPSRTARCITQHPVEPPSLNGVGRDSARHPVRQIDSTHQPIDDAPRAPAQQLFDLTIGFFVSVFRRSLRGLDDLPEDIPSMEVQQTIAEKKEDDRRPEDQGNDRGHTEMTVFEPEETGHQTVEMAPAAAA